MSAVDETVRRETERGGSVKLVLGARGQVQVEAKGYVEDEPGSLAAAAEEVQRVFDLLVARYGGGA